MRFLRRFSSSSSFEKIKNTNEWMKRHLKDKYVVAAGTDNYRARSAYKLIEIQARYKLIQPGDVIVECGGAPGAWTQVLTQIQGGKGVVVSCDLLDIEPVEGATTLQRTDFTLPESQAKIMSYLGEEKIDLVLSDMAPNITGNGQLDQDQITNLVYAVIKFSLQYSAPGGSLLAKSFKGDHTNRIIADLQRFYRRIDCVKPDSSRKESAELYLLARNFVGVKPKKS